MATDTGISGVLTDGTGVSKFTVPKVIKDFIADALLGASAGLVTANILSVPTDSAQATIALLAVANAVIHAGYRAVLKWAQT